MWLVEESVIALVCVSAAGCLGNAGGCWGGECVVSVGAPVYASTCADIAYATHGSVMWVGVW